MNAKMILCRITAKGDAFVLVTTLQRCTKGT